MNVTVYTIAYQEEFMLPHFISHYRSMFPGCHIVVYDNQSTDRTFDIARDHHCEVITYDTAGRLDDATYLHIKNNCWKTAKTDWVIVVDVDEFYCIDKPWLEFEEMEDATIFKAQGFNMVNLSDNMNIEEIKTGILSESYDKVCLFNKRFVKEINYGPGCHGASPVGRIKFGNSYKLLHYKYLNPDYMVARHKVFASRLSENNLAKGFGTHYLYTEEQIRQEFAEARKNAIKIL